LNLCVPDNKKACAACCGMMNHQNISKHNIDSFLKDGPFRIDNAWRYQIEGCYPEQSTDCRDASSHICPFVGFISTGCPGCLIHPLYSGSEQRDMALFGAQTCINYSCPAMTIFTDDHVNIITTYIDDWYLYTIAVIDPLSTIWMIENLKKIGIDENHREFSKRLNIQIENHSKTLNDYEETIFCYSVDEYKMAHERFSIKNNI